MMGFKLQDSLQRKSNMLENIRGLAISHRLRTSHHWMVHIRVISELSPSWGGLPSTKFSPTWIIGAKTLRVKCSVSVLKVKKTRTVISAAWFCVN